MLKIRETDIQILTYGDGLVEGVDYFCVYEVNSRTRITPAAVDYTSKVLTCSTAFVSTYQHRCISFHIVDSLGNEFKYEEESSIQDEACFIESLDIQGRIKPHLIPQDVN